MINNSKSFTEGDRNYTEDILMENNGFGENCGGMTVPNKNAPIDCPGVYPDLGIETSFGSDPKGEMFGMSAPDKMALSNYIPRSESEVMEETNFPIELQHELQEGTRGE